MQIVGGDVNAELGPGIGIERPSVGMHTLNKSDSRGDWLEQWLMLQKFVALNTTYKKTPEKQITYRTPDAGLQSQMRYGTICDSSNKKGGLPKPDSKNG